MCLLVMTHFNTNNECIAHLLKPSDFSPQVEECNKMIKHRIQTKNNSTCWFHQNNHFKFTDNKDGSKKEPPKDAKPTKQPPSGQEASKSGGQQQSKPDKQSIEQKLQQVVVSEPVPSTFTSQPAEPPGQQGALSMGQGDQPAQPKVWSQQQPPPKQQGQSKAAAPGKGQGQGRGQPPSKGNKIRIE